MRLISCYIENFGGLSQYRLDFQEGLTVVLEDNGFGKTTLAEFIRAMFYGFPRSGKALDKNPRKKYAPWNGGAWGGNLTFEHNGKVYRIDRRFGATPKGDTFELTDARTHKKSGDFTANIGVELFGLDADSFERSTYMPQSHDHTTIATTGIQSKLGDLVHDTNDINSYDNAIKALKEKRSGYIPFRGKGGSVAEAVSRITELQEQLDLAESRRPELERLLTQLEEASSSKAEKTGVREDIRTQIRERAQYDAKASAEKQLLSLEKRKDQLEKQLRSLLEQYPQGLPSMNELKRMEYLLGRLPLLAPQSQTQTDLDAQHTLDQLGARFASGIPEEPFFSDLRRLDRELIEGESALKNTVLTDQELTRLAQLEDRLEQLNRIEGLRQEHLRISSAGVPRLPGESAAGSFGGNPLLPMLLGVLLVCLGITGVFFEYLVPGILSLALGIALLALGFSWKLKQEVARELRTAVPVRAEQLRETCAGLRERLDAALSPYFPQGTAGNYTAAIARLEGESRQYAAAFSHLSEQRRMEEARTVELEKCREELEDFTRKYAISKDLTDPEHFHWLRYDVQNYPRLRQELRQAAEELRAFRQDHGQILTLPPREDLPDPETLKHSEEHLTGVLQSLEQKLAALEQRRRILYTQIDAIPQMRDELAQWQERRLQGIQNCTLLDQTIAFLEQAREALSARYMGTVQQRFLGYMNRLSPETQDRVFVTADLEVTVERFGEPRPLDHFSAGQTDLVALCMRLALVDALFRDTRPLLILDDPFVNLDERNLEQALAVLKDLSRDHQILYLVCNGSRIPK